MATIFLSYESSDRACADQLRQGLESDRVHRLARARLSDPRRQFLPRCDREYDPGQRRRCRPVESQCGLVCLNGPNHASK